MAKPKTSVIVAAGGLSRRFSTVSKKQFALLNKKPLLVHCLNTFNSNNNISEIVVVAPRDELLNTKKVINEYNFNKVAHILEGGKERRDSVYNGFCQLSADTEIVIIHDAARPFVTNDIIERTVISAIEYGASISAIPINDTVKKIYSNYKIEKTVPRENMWRAQTPQTFRYDILKKVYLETDLKSSLATDESQLVEEKGFQVKICEGSGFNIKITTQNDLSYAEHLINSGKVVNNV